MSDIVSQSPFSYGINFVGTYPPRRCGIATFTYDLARAVAQRAGSEHPVSICAMNDAVEGYAYPEEVKFEINDNAPTDYARAADFLNFSGIGVVSLQHEFGIFDGQVGSNVLALLRELRRPVVATCHTVMKEPSPARKQVMCEMASQVDRLVVMSSKAFAILKDVYGIDKDKIVHIPHGIHEMPFTDPSFFKDKYGLEGRRVLLTFGLLSPPKGIEYMIEAMPAVVSRHPDVIYVILGETHPHEILYEGESYRLRLQRKVRDLGLQEHVLFHPRFCEHQELQEYLGAADIFITPYVNLDQITSGTLSYAVGAGKAVVSTPYWHAQELLADERGKLVPPCDPDKLAVAVNALLADPTLLNRIRKNAYLYSRRMVWPAVAKSYLELFEQTRQSTPSTIPTPRATALSSAITPSNVPVPDLTHLERLSDDTGAAHHACGILPDWRYGYALDDAAAGLVTAARYYESFGSKKAAAMAEKCLALLQYLISDTKVLSGIDYTRHPQAAANECSVGKAIWALGYAVSHGPPGLSITANTVFNRLVPRHLITDSRGAAYAVLGAANYLNRFKGASAVERFLKSHLPSLQKAVADSDWLLRWEGADPGVAVQALAVAGALFEDTELQNTASELVVSLNHETEAGTVFLHVAPNPKGEELPRTATSYIEALGAVYYITHAESLLDDIRRAADWFLGSNRICQSLYDFSSCGCHDALTTHGLNNNQGTEATLSCLLAFLTLHELALPFTEKLNSTPSTQSATTDRADVH